MKQDTHEFEFKKKPKEISTIVAVDTGPPPIVWQLAFAHRVDKEIAQSKFPNRAAAARHYGITRARLTQIMNLLWLAPRVLDEILGFVEHGEQRLSERALRSAAARIAWGEQASTLS